MPTTHSATYSASIGADIVEAAVLRLPVLRSAVGPHGIIADPEIRDRAASIVAALAAHVRIRQSE